MMHLPPPLPRAEAELTASLQLSAQRSRGGFPSLVWVPCGGWWGEYCGNQHPEKGEALSTVTQLARARMSPAWCGYPTAWGAVWGGGV